MKTYSYKAVFEPGEGENVFVVTFPDIPEAITEGTGMTEAMANAADALGVALLTYLELGRPLPAQTKPLNKNGRLLDVAPLPDQAAKIAVIETFQSAGISRTELARRMGKDEKEARRVLDPNTATKIGLVSLALEAMGQRMVIGLEAAE